MKTPVVASTSAVTTCLCLFMMTGCAGLTTPLSHGNPGEDGLRLEAIDQRMQAEACRLTAMELAAHEKDEHAIAQFEQARKLDPNLKGIAHPLAVLYDRQQRLDAAQREYERATTESPRNADVHNDFGYFLYSRGDYANARKQLEQALSLNSEHSKAQINLAMVLAAEGEYEEAFDYFEQALGPAAAHHNVGVLQFRAGNREEALAHLQKSAATDPSLGSAEMLTTLMNVSDQTEILPVGYSK